MASGNGGTDGCNNQPGTNTTHVIPPGGFSESCRQSYQPSWGEIRPFLSVESGCNPTPLTKLYSDVYQRPGAFVSDGSAAPGELLTPRNAFPDPNDENWAFGDTLAAPIEGCESVGFKPEITLEPTNPGGAASQATDSPSGLDVELRVPQHQLPFNTPPDNSSQGEVDQYISDALDYWRSNAGLASAHLKDTVVTLPEGMTLNPAAADGQGVCTPAQIGLTDTASPTPPAIRFDNAPIGCPDSSKVGEVVVETPLLEPADWPTGNVYLAAQGANPFGSDFAIYIAVRSPERGVIVKLAGKVEPDPATGRLRTTFAQNPQLPFGRFSLDFEQGPRAPLATPVTCGTHTTTTALTPYSTPTTPALREDPFELTASPAARPCPTTPPSAPSPSASWRAPPS